MFIFGHIGVTLGAAVAGSGAYQVIQERFKGKQIEKSPLKSSGRDKSKASISTRQEVAFLPAWVERLGRFIDLRLLIIGSLLPDIIDKPIGNFFFSRTFENGRIFGHTLLFLLVLLAPGFILFWKRKKSWLLALAFGTAAHLIFDQLWQTPQTLFWPLFGLEFPKLNEPDIIGTWLTTLKTNPAAYIPELLGAVIILSFSAWLILKRKAGRFLIRGEV